MRLVFVDTNYFVRLIENDVDSQVVEVKELFESGVNGKVKLCSSVIVLFEIYWLLKSFYGKKDIELQTILNKLVGMSYVEWQEREVLIAAVNRLRLHGGDLEDSYNMCWAREKEADIFASFDKKLKKRWRGK